MLKMMRSGAQSKVLKLFLFGMLMLGSIGLSLFGVQDIFRSGLRSNSIASIGREKISKSEFDGILQSTLRRLKIGRNEAYRLGVPQQTLQREINSRVMLRAASDLGFYIDDKTAARRLDEMMAPLTKAGMTRKDALDRILYSTNTSEGALVADIKAEIAIDRISHALTDGMDAPGAMVDDFLKYQHESRRGEYLRLTAADAGLKEPTDEELKEFYKSMQMHYMVPELRSFAVLVFDPKSLGAANFTDADRQAFYKDHMDAFGQPETREVQQVSVKTEAEAQKIYDEVSSSKNLKKAADAAGKDKAQFISGTYAKDKFIPAELADDVFKAAAGEVMKPAKGPFGWQVVYVAKVNPGSAKTYEQVKDDIEKALENSDTVRDAFMNKVNDIDDMIGGGKTLSEVAQSLGLKEVDFDKVSAKGFDSAGKKADDKGVPAFDKVLEQVFTLDKGQAGQMIEAEGDKYVLAETRDIVPTQPQPFESVRADVVQAWKDKQAGDALDVKAGKILDRLKGGETLDHIAADMNKTLQKTPFLQRNTPPSKADGLDAATLNALFGLAKTGDAATVPGPGTVTIIQLGERKTDIPAESSKEDTQALRYSLSQSMRADLLEQFRRSLIAKYDVSIDEKALQEMYAPKDGEEEEDQ